MLCETIQSAGFQGAHGTGFLLFAGGPAEQPPTRVLNMPAADGAGGNV